MIKILLLSLGVIGSIFGLIDTTKRLKDAEAYADMGTLFFAVGFALSIVVLSGHIIALII